MLRAGVGCSTGADPEALLAALAEELPGVAVIGGGATEDGSVGETFQFCGDVVACDSVSGMLLAGEFELNKARLLGPRR